MSIHTHFSVSGAVQCGFCIPGMVMLFLCSQPDREQDPAPGDVRDAIKNNICRCTGYKKIEEDPLAAKMFREDIPVPEGHLWSEKSGRIFPDRCRC